MVEIRHYITDDGLDVFEDWRDKLADNKTKVVIDRRVARVELGNFGDHKPCREGVWELRIDFGPGYRIYYAQAGQAVVLLLCGGAKRSQDADVEKACAYWKDWRQSNPKQEKER